MKYSVNINKTSFADNTGVELENWKDVTNLLKNQLTFNTIKVEIFKYSPDRELVWEKDVTMGNLFEIANLETDESIS